MTWQLSEYDFWQNCEGNSVENSLSINHTITTEYPYANNELKSILIPYTNIYSKRHKCKPRSILF